MVLLYCLLISTGTLLISLHDTYLFSLFCLQEFLESSYPWISKILWKCQLLHIFIHQTLARPPSVKIHIILSVLKNYFLFFVFFFFSLLFYLESLGKWWTSGCSSDFSYLLSPILFFFWGDFLDFYLPIFLLKF